MNKTHHIFISRIKKEIAQLHAGLTGEGGFPQISGFLQEYADTGKMAYQVSFTEMGMEFTNYYNHPSELLEIFSAQQFSGAALAFMENGNQETFNTLLQGYYYDILLQEAGLLEHKLIPAKLETDLALCFIFSAAFFPAKAPVVAAQLTRFLQEERKQPDIKGNYGRDNVLPLAVWMAEQLGLPGQANVIRTFCRTPVDAAYAAAMQEVFSTDNNTVTRWIEALGDFHIRNSKDNLTLPFNHTSWQYFPVEILALLQWRAIKELDNTFIDHPLVSEFIPWLPATVPVPLNEFTQKLERRLTAG